MVGKKICHISKNLCTIALKPSKFTQKMLIILHVKNEVYRVSFQNFIGKRQVKVLGQSSQLRLWCEALTIKLFSDWLINGVCHKCFNKSLL